MQNQVRLCWQDSQTQDTAVYLVTAKLLKDYQTYQAAVYCYTTTAYTVLK